MHLGASKKDYYLGCLISYGILAFCISLVNTVIHRLIDPIYPAQTVINMMDVCQWTENGMIVAGLQQMFFLLLVMVFSSYAIVHADALVWVANGRGINCNYLYFYADCTITRYPGWTFPDNHV